MARQHDYAAKFIERPLPVQVTLISQPIRVAYTNFVFGKNSENMSFKQVQPLIQTKLQPPIVAPNTLSRPQLVQRLQNGRFRKLTLISAPAGYGKSVLASMWQAACDCPVAWISLDENDNDLGVFLSYVINAIQIIYPDAYKETAILLNGIQLPSSNVLLTSLINETVELSQPLTLIFDDYHLIQNADIHQFMRQCIDYQTDQTHFVFVTRQDPPFDIANLRAKSQLNEIRLTDLRFSEKEAQDYLSTHLTQDIPEATVQTLLQRIEGWPAGLRLTVLAMRHHKNQSQFLEAFKGTSQYVMDYLLSQVLSQQTQSVQKFLLYTSVLDRFCVPLCDALLAGEDQDIKPDSQEILDFLQQEQLFLIPLDHEGQWFRYHHLFRDLLRHQLSAVASEATINQLHWRVSTWFAEQGLIEEALAYAFLTNDIEWAVQVFAQARYSLINLTQWQTIKRLLYRFPREVIERSPDLLLSESWLFYHHSRLTKLPNTLVTIDQLIQNSDLAPDKKSHLSGELFTLQSFLLYYVPDRENCALQAEQAIKLVASELWAVRILARLLLALTHQIVGDVNRAYTTIYSSFDVESEQSDRLTAHVLVTACFIDFLSANLNSMHQHAAQIVALDRDRHSLSMMGYGHYFLGTALFLQNDLTAAKQQFAFADQHPQATYTDSYVYSICGLARIYQAFGQDQQARELVDNALAYLLSNGNVMMLSVMQAFQAELAYRQGRLVTALQWANQFDTPPPLTSVPWLYAPHLTLVRIWLAENSEHSRKKSADLLNQLRAFLETTHNTLILTKTLILQASLYQQNADDAAAQNALEQALLLATPGNIVRPFVDAGASIYPLLDSQTSQNADSRALRAKILKAIAPTVNDIAAQTVIEPLTERELDILALLARRQSNKEIAQKLSISPHTVHSHVKNIFTKLDVHNRRQAVNRARELSLITPTS
jgi:LuxR family maltose regulon positive regulatory protein